MYIKIYIYIKWGNESHSFLLLNDYCPVGHRVFGLSTLEGSAKSFSIFRWGTKIELNEPASYTHIFMIARAMYSVP